jgi:hypothetical protein
LSPGTHQPHDRDQRHDRTLDLLCERSLWGLDAREQRELDALATDSDIRAADDQFDAAVAALDCVFHADADEPLPEALRTRCAEAAASVLSPSPIPFRAAAAKAAAASRPAARTNSWAAGLGWFAAAAALVFAAVLWASRATPTASPAAPDYRAMMAAALERGGVVRSDWASIAAANLAPAPHRLDHQTSGTIVWDDKGQQGWMTFAGLEKNDPSKFQYQLWIFDAKRGGLEQHPVDGGVFDVTEDGEVILPIDAKLPVDRPFLFAVTVEPPGGSVVSDRDIVVVAPVQQG